MLDFVFVHLQCIFHRLIEMVLWLKILVISITYSFEIEIVKIEYIPNLSIFKLPILFKYREHSKLSFKLSVIK